MGYEWQLRTSGPVDARQTVLLLPGGTSAAGSYAEVMAQPSLSEVRLVAATLPANAGAAPPPDGDYSVEGSARMLSELAKEVGADVVVGFSNGASVALEMVASGGFIGPTVLLGMSMSAAAESSFFLTIVRLCNVFGSAPVSVLTKGAASMVKRIPVSAERRAELKHDFARNVPGEVRRALEAYVRWLRSPDSHAERLCRSGQPTWIVHGEKGDGSLTAEERRTLEGCPSAHLVTLPGTVWFIPNEVPDKVAALIVEALAAV